MIALFGRKTSSFHCESYSDSFTHFDGNPFRDFLVRQKVLLRGAMVKGRTAIIPFFGYQHRVHFNLSNLAGHASFIALAISYLESDFLSLRLYAMSGIVMSMIFQYYRPLPLWIPIRWNGLFFVINSIMVVLMIVEENEALNIPKDEIEILRNVFGNHGQMKAVDFRHLMGLAKRRNVEIGEKIVNQGNQSQ